MTSAEPLPDDEVFNPGRVKPTRTKPRRKPETEIVAEVLKMINALPQGRARKKHGGAFGQVGEPDVDACVRGRSLKLEGKAPGNKPTGAQLGVMRSWAKSGALVGWFFNTEHVRTLLEHVDDPGFAPDLAFPGCTCAKHGRPE